jgi:hypothetical protein
MIDIRNQYMAKVKQDHKTAAIRTGFQPHARFWYHTEFWIKDPEDLRLYTSIFRDWIYPHMKWFVIILLAWYAGNFMLLA